MCMRARSGWLEPEWHGSIFFNAETLRTREGRRELLLLESRVSHSLFAI